MTITEEEKSKIDTILDLYRNVTFMDIYGSSVICLVLLVVLFLLLLSYIYAMSNRNSIRDDWINQRCEPFVIPFAGFINKPPDQTVTEFTGSNFNYCINSILLGITGTYVEPFQYLTNILTSTFTEISDSLQSVRALIDTVRSAIAVIVGDVYGRFLALGVELQLVILGMMDSIAKTQATLVVGFESAVSTYYVMKSLMGAILQFLVMFLIVLVPVILASFFMGPWIWVPMLTFYTVTAVILGLLIHFIGELMGITPGLSIPGVPKPSVCFDGDTQIDVLLSLGGRVTQTAEATAIRDVQVGDMTRDGKVTAKLTLDARSQRDRMFDLDGVCVSADHYVWDKEGGLWVRTHEHPRSVQRDKPYMAPLLYCLNTTNKRIHLGNTVFADWDDVVTSQTMQRLRKAVDKGRNNIPTPFPDNIHRVLDGGFVPSTLVKDATGKLRALKDIQPGDVLEGGVEVVGVVEVEGRDVLQYAYLLPGGVTVCGGPQLVYRVEENGTWISTRNIDEKHDMKQLTSTTHMDVLFHLVTNTGMFWLHGIEIGDYNSLVDYYLK